MKKNKNNKSSNSQVFGRWPQAKRGKLGIPSKMTLNVSGAHDGSCWIALVNIFFLTCKYPYKLGRV